MKGSALFSKDRRYRYALGRIWDPARPTILFIGSKGGHPKHPLYVSATARLRAFS